MQNTSLWRKKSLPNLVVKAVQVTAENAEEVALWCNGWVVDEIDPFDNTVRQPGINVPCETGNERASVGHYVFETSQGAFRVRAGGVFQSLWEPKPKQ